MSIPLRRHGGIRGTALLTAAVCAGLALVFFHKLLLGGMILARGDVYAYFYPYWSVRNAALLAGYIPLWTPDVFMGAPLLANSQVGLFYPPNWPLAPFDPPAGIALSLVLHSAWGLLGAYALGGQPRYPQRLPPQRTDTQHTPRAMQHQTHRASGRGGEGATRPRRRREECHMAVSQKQAAH